MLKRTITGIFILIVTAGFVLLREVSEYFFDAFALAIIYGAVFEIARCYVKNNKKVNLPVVFIYPLAVMFIYIFAENIASVLLLILALMLLAFIYCMATELVTLSVSRKKGEETEPASLLESTKNTFQILIYPATLLSFLFGMNHLGLKLGYVAIILTFAISMMTDVFAYFFGSLIKGVKMCPEISPKKSIAGMVSGAIGGMAISAVMYVLFVHLGLLGNCFANYNPAWRITLFVLLGVFGTFLTQFGDLVASAFKRRIGIKDFGNIFPGHGGFMDRVDGLMFTGALVFILLLI